VVFLELLDVLSSARERPVAAKDSLPRSSGWGLGGKLLLGKEKLK